MFQALVHPPKLTPGDKVAVVSAAFAAQRKFVADASHELRTPLTVMRGQLELLAADENPSQEELTRVERLVQAEIAHVSRLVDDLLLLAHSERRGFLRVRLRCHWYASLWYKRPKPQRDAAKRRILNQKLPYSHRLLLGTGGEAELETSLTTLSGTLTYGEL